MKEKILNLFYNDKLSQKTIAEQLHISKGYVSRIVTNDRRYKDFKKEKLAISKKNHNSKIQQKVEEKRKQIQFKYAVDDLILKKIHMQASLEMSKSNYLTNESYRKWNCSAYKYNSNKKRYEFDEQLGHSRDVPKYIKIK